MKKKTAVIIIILCAVSLFFSAQTASNAAEKKGVILATTDLKQDYEILGLVSYRTGDLSPNKINDEMKKQAESMGADYVISIIYYNNAGYLYGSGTAVKLIKKDKGN